MWNKISLRARISLILASLLFITLTGGMILGWYTFQIEQLLTSITGKTLTAFQTAISLETAFTNQKGLA